MRIIYTTDLSRPGNDCYIYESVSLVEAFGMYTVITAKKITGWAEREEITVHHKGTASFQKAKYWFTQAGGVVTQSN